MRYFAVEPFGPRSQAHPTAYLASLIAASKGVTIEPDDILAALGYVAAPEPPAPMTEEEEAAELAALNLLWTRT